MNSAKLGYSFIQAVWLMLSHVFEECESSFAPMGLGVKQFVVLAILDKQNTPGALRSALGAPASTITNIINELEKKQLIKREIHPEDRRQYVLRRTDLGAEFLKKGMGAVEEVLAVRAAGMSEEDLAAFQRVESILFGWAIKSS